MFGFTKKLFSRASTGPEQKFTPQFTSEMQRELEAIGSGSGGSDLTAGIGMIKMGASELLPGWVELFNRSSVYSVSVEDVGVPFVFGPPGDRTYVAVFTTESLARLFLAEMPLLKAVIPFTGLDLVRSAEVRGLGLWINPLNEACTLKVPAAMVGMFWKKETVPTEPPSSTPPPLPKKEPMRTGKGHPGIFDTPINSLEEALVALRERKMEVPRFLEELFNSEIYILPLHGDIVESSSETGGLALSKAPTIFCMNYPEYSALGLFTAPERAKPTCELHPEFRFVTAVQAGDFLLSLKGDFGIVLNPYWDVNIEWTNEQASRILGMMRRD